MDKMDKNPAPYKESGYEDLFEAAESESIVGEDVVLYSQSLAKLRSIQAGLDYRFEQGIEQGMEQGLKQGLKQGREEDFKAGKEDMARKMKKAELDINFISSY